MKFLLPFSLRIPLSSQFQRFPLFLVCFLFLGVTSFPSLVINRMPLGRILAPPLNFYNIPQSQIKNSFKKSVLSIKSADYSTLNGKSGLSRFLAYIPPLSKGQKESNLSFLSPKIIRNNRFRTLSFSIAMSTSSSSFSTFSDANRFNQDNAFTNKNDGNRGIHFYNNRMGASSSFLTSTHLYAANPLITNSLANEKRLPGFVDSLTSRPDTKFLLYSRGKPLIQITSDSGLNTPHWLSIKDLKELMGFIYDSSNPENVDISEANMPLMVVLGEDDRHPSTTQNLNLNDEGEVILQENGGNNWRIAIDITKYEDKVQQYFHIDDFSADSSHLDKKEDVSYTFGNIRALYGILNPSDIAILGQGFALISFNNQHAFCSKCGSPTVSSEGGTRRKCVNVGNCNYKAYPRVDPVCIVLVYDPSTDRILLGRSKGYRPGMFSCLAGFLELCESLEEGVKREVFEESGIRLGKLRYHSSQPWPIGRGASCQIMVGFLAEATSKEINMDKHELEACRWFTRAEVAAAKEIKVSGTATTKGAENENGNENDSNTLRVPGPYAIAHHLIKEWLENVPPHSNL